MTAKLAELDIHELAEIVSISDKTLEAKLFSMGCYPGEKVCIEKKSLFGDPLLIRTGGTMLSLRKVNAAEILVKKLAQQ